MGTQSRKRRKHLPTRVGRQVGWRRPPRLSQRQTPPASRLRRDAAFGPREARPPPCGACGRQAPAGAARHPRRLPRPMAGRHRTDGRGPHAHELRKLAPGACAAHPRWLPVGSGRLAAAAGVARRQKSREALASDGAAHPCVVRRAFGEVHRWGLLAANPAQHVRVPRVPRRQPRPFTAPEVAALLDAARHERLLPLLTLALSTSLRLGELLALRWQDVDLIQGMLAVRQTRRRDGTLVEPKCR